MNWLDIHKHEWFPKCELGAPGGIQSCSVHPDSSPNPRVMPALSKWFLHHQHLHPRSTSSTATSVSCASNWRPSPAVLRRWAAISVPCWRPRCILCWRKLVRRRCWSARRRWAPYGTSIRSVDTLPSRNWSMRTLTTCLMTYHSTFRDSAYIHRLHRCWQFCWLTLTAACWSGTSFRIWISATSAQLLFSAPRCTRSWRHWVRFQQWCQLESHVYWESKRTRKKMWLMAFATTIFMFLNFVFCSAFQSFYQGVHFRMYNFARYQIMSIFGNI